jgi:hypothetical protein
MRGGSREAIRTIQDKQEWEGAGGGGPVAFVLVSLDAVAPNRCYRIAP